MLLWLYTHKTKGDYMKKPNKMLVKERVNFSKIKPIPGFDGYWADPNGSIYSIKKLTPRLWHDGYLRLAFFGVKKGHIRKAVHQIMAITFVRRRKNKNIVRHLDGNRLNNSIKNLAWGDQKENQTDMIRHGRSQRGEKNHTCKLKISDVKKIKNHKFKRGDIRMLAKKYNVSHQTIQAIKYGRNWKWL